MKANHNRSEDPSYIMADWWLKSPRAHLWRPPTDVYETEDQIIILVEISGMKVNDFLIKLEHNLLTITGTRVDPIEKRSVHLMEINYGDFYASIEIPIAIQRENIEAEYQNGFLKVMIPKAKPIQITPNQGE